MKIFVAHASSFDFEQELYEPLRTLSSQRGDQPVAPTLAFTFPHENKDKNIVTKDIIKSCDIVIAEVSCPSTGMGIELGWADAFGIPIIGMYREGTQISASISKITQNFFVYTDKKHMIELLEKALAYSLFT